MDILELAEQRINTEYGARVSIADKDKVINKWGYVSTSTTGAWSLISLSTANYPVANTITHVTAGSGDVADVRLEGHYLTADGEFVFVVQTVTLNGANNVELDVPLARASRAYVVDSSVPTGPVYLRIGSGGTTVLSIPAGETQTEYCGTTISYKDYYVLTAFGGSVLGGNNAKVEFRLEVRTKGGVWRPQARWALNASQTNFHRELSAPLVVPANAGVRIMYKSDTASTAISGHFSGYLALDRNRAGEATPAPL